MAEITRREKYLKAIGDGDSSGLPDQITRRERFLAKAVGMDVKTPNPITREEKYLANISGGGGGGGIDVEAITITENGTTAAPEGKAYSPVVTNVPNTYTAGDEGKVVSNGALVAQTGITVTENGTVDTTLNDEVIVDVPTSGGGNGVLWLTQNNGGFPLTIRVVGLIVIVSKMFSNGTGSDASNVYTDTTQIELPGGIIDIGSYAFSRCTKLVSINLPDSLQELNNYTFRGCESLVLTNLPSSLLRINTNVFYGCTNLALTSLPSGLVYLGGGSFYNCPQLSLTSLPSGITEILSQTFYGCTGLGEMKFNGDITAIAASAFSGCVNILKYDFTNNTAVPTLANVNAFQNINANCKIIVPDSLYNDWIAANNWSTYASYIVKESEYTA